MAIIDWFSRKVLSWRVFNTMDALQYANLLISMDGKERVLDNIRIDRLWRSLNNELERKRAA